MKLWKITEHDIVRMDNFLSALGDKLESFKGTMTMHQLTLKVDGQGLVKNDFRTLSCCDCSLGTICTHYSVKSAVKKSSAKKRKQVLKSCKRNKRFRDTGSPDNQSTGKN